MRNLVVLLLLMVMVMVMVIMSGCVVGQDVRKKELVPAMFVFGDSLIDNGNNNNLPSFAKANYFPYGIDFNAGPTGRFSNAYTIVDQIGTITNPFLYFLPFFYYSLIPYMCLIFIKA